MKDKENKTKQHFNYQLFYRRTALIIYDILSVTASSFLAILLRYDMHLDEIPDQYFYEFFHIRSMTDPVYDGISRDLMSRGYYALLARFSEFHKDLKRFLHEYN